MNTSLMLHCVHLLLTLRVTLNAYYRTLISMYPTLQPRSSPLLESGVDEQE